MGLNSQSSIPPIVRGYRTLNSNELRICTHIKVVQISYKNSHLLQRSLFSFCLPCIIIIKITLILFLNTIKTCFIFLKLFHNVFFKKSLKCLNLFLIFFLKTF